MQSYELTYLIAPELTEEEVRELQEKITSLAQEEGGLLIEGSGGKATKRKLAYPIDKKTQAYLAVLKFQLPRNKIEEFKRKTKEESQIIRFLIIVKEAPKKAPEKRRTVEKKESPKKEKVEIKEIDKKLDELLE